MGSTAGLSRVRYAAPNCGAPWLLGMPNRADPNNTAEKDYQDLYEELVGISQRQCPECKQGRMVMVEILPRLPCKSALSIDSS